MQKVKNGLGIVVLVGLVAIGVVAAFAFADAATNLSFSNTFTLSPGTYCLEEEHEVDGNELHASLTVTDGACDNGGETVVIAGGEEEEDEEVVIPSECPDLDYNVITEGSGVTIRGTSGPDFITAGTGVKVRARGGDDCVVVGSGSKVYGQGGDDHITTGSGSYVRGGTGDDICFAGVGSNVKCEVYSE